MSELECEGKRRNVMEHTFHYLVFTETEQYGDIYHKADADLVIAERDKVIEEQENLIATLKKERNWLAKDRAQAYNDLEKRAQLNIKQEESIRRQKYKRCLNMANWCFTRGNFFFVVGRSEGGRFAEERFRRSNLYSKWHKRWLKIAEQFKEAKCR